MTSLFEHVAPRGGTLPVDLVYAGTRGVSLLEFVAADFRPEIKSDTAAEPVDLHAQAEQERVNQVAVMIDAAREAAGNEMKQALEHLHQTQLEAQRLRVTAAVDHFAAERTRYFAQAEAEVVRLALAVAGRILHREAEADPLSLSAAVHAALSSVQDGSGCTLRVSPGDVEAWELFLERNGDVRLLVAADRQLAPGDLHLDTCIGSVELGAATQLTEVARTFRERRGC